MQNVLLARSEVGASLLTLIQVGLEVSRRTHRGAIGTEEVPIGHLGNARFGAKKMIFSLAIETIAQKHWYIFRFGFVIPGSSAAEANVLQ